MAPFAMTVNDV